MLVAAAGKTNCGKSTFFSAATLVDVEISNRVFTTIKPNVGVAYVVSDCVCQELKVKCNPQNSKCVNGKRLIPLKLIDIAGLIPEAHKGKGLGLTFLDEIMQAQAIIHIVDASGGTDKEGNPVPPGTWDPCNDVSMLEEEMAQWIKDIVTKNWPKISKSISVDETKIVSGLTKQLSGLGIKEEEVKEVLKQKSLGKPVEWSESEILDFAKAIREKSKPILIAANKIDKQAAEENLKKLRERFPEKLIVPCSAESELALRRAAEKKLIEYVPGAKEFKELGEMEEKQKKALKFIKVNVLEKYGSSGVQEAINKTAFELLDLMVVYPVEDANKFMDSKGNVLPDAILLKKGSTALDLAYKIHTEIGEKFVAAIDCKTRKKIGRETELKPNDVIKIQTS